MADKRSVYILRSKSDPDRHYVGITSDLDGRLEWHNHGPSGHTTHYRPWSLVVSMKFPTERAAVRFEKYLKSGSGRAFARRTSVRQWVKWVGPHHGRRHVTHLRLDDPVGLTFLGQARERSCLSVRWP